MEGQLVEMRYQIQWDPKARLALSSNGIYVTDGTVTS